MTHPLGRTLSQSRDPDQRLCELCNTDCPAGSWMVTRFDEADGVHRTFVFNLANGGSCIMHDISPVFITGLGAWKAKGRKLTATVWVGTPDMPPEQPAVTFRVEVDGTVRGDEMSGTFTYDDFLIAGRADAVSRRVLREPGPRGRCRRCRHR